MIDTLLCPSSFSFSASSPLMSLYQILGGIKMVLKVTVGSKWADALKKRYPRSSIKLIAADFAVSEKTAKQWLAGQCPRAEYFVKAWELWGLSFINETLNPGKQVSKSAVVFELQQTAEKLNNLKEQIVSIFGGGHD